LFGIWNFGIGIFFFSDMPSSPKIIARSGILVAVSVALGWLTITIPNVELITASIFVSGCWCGPLWGMAIGIVAETLFSVTNPVGIPLPPLLIAQCLGMGFSGLAGGLVQKRWRNPESRTNSKIPSSRTKPGDLFRTRISLGAIGLLITIIFDILTTLSFPLSSGFRLSQIWKVLIMGIPFVAIHWISNVAIFVIIVPLILKRLPLANPRLSTVSILLFLLCLSHPISAQEIIPPHPPDTVRTVVPDSLMVDTLAIDSVAFDTSHLAQVVMDTLPPLERIFAPMPDGGPTDFSRYLDRVDFLEPEVEDMGDVVRYFPSTYPFDMATFGAFSGMSIQGQSPRRSRYDLDGRNLNHRRNGMVDLNEITFEEIERISNDPMGSWSEPPATGGTVGFRSYLPMSDIPYSRIDLRAGYYGFTTVDFHLAQKAYRNWYANIVGQVGYFDTRGENTAAQSVHFRSHLTYKPTPLWSGRISYYHYRSKNDIPFPISHHKTVRNDLVLSLARRLYPDSESRLELQTWVTDIAHNDQDIFHEDERRAGGDLRIVTPMRGTALCHSRESGNPDVCHGSLWGGLFAETWEIQSQDDPSRADSEFRLFAGAYVPIVSKLTMQSSLLYSLYQSGINEPAGSIALSYRPWDWIGLRGISDWAFRVPSYFEQYGHGRLDIRDDLVEPLLLFAHLDTLVAATELHPERSRTFSGSVDLLLPWSLRFSIGAYRKQLTDPIIFREIADGFVQASNGNRTTWQGGYVTGRWAIWDSLEIAGSLSANDPIDDPDHYVPDKNGWGAITYRHTYFHGDLRMIGRLEGVYWGERILSRHLRTYTVPEASVINFRISATIKDFTIFWGMNNVYPERYQLLGGFPMIHREEIYGVRWNFLD